MAFIVAAFRTAENRELARTVLDRDGHTSVVFGAGAAAVTEALAGAADVLVVEHELADMSAGQVCAAMRSQPPTATIPIVVCGPAAVHPGSGDGRVIRTALQPWALREAVAAALTPAVPTLLPVPVIRAECAANTVLLVEDDASIAEPLTDGLARHGFQVTWVATGAAALTAAPAAMVLLDLGLPDLNGLEVCRRLRRAGDTPVIMLTARGNECDRVIGLELGADDYLAKPFSLRELVARMRAVTRRTRPLPAVGESAVPGRAG